MLRTEPNIIITGTPGVGKSSHATLLSEKLPHLNLIQITEPYVKEHSLHSGYDDILKSWIIDDDKILDHLEPLLEHGGIIIDWHVCDIFPERLIDLVVVLRAENKVLYDRLKERGYGERKLEENLDAEIMGVVEEEAREGYEEGVVVVLRSDEVEEVELNVERVVGWYEAWKTGNPEGVSGEKGEESEDDEE